MATKIRKSTSSKKVARFRRKARIRGSTQGTTERPRLCVFRSNAHFYAQVIDDAKRVTLAAASTAEDELRKTAKNTVDGAKTIGSLVAKRALAKNIAKVVFDRGGYLYHGRVKSFADAAREAGLEF